MVRSSSGAIFVLTVIVALSLPLAVVDVFTFLDAQCGAGTTASAAADEEAAPLLDSVAEVLPPLAAVGSHFAAVVLTNRHLMGRHIGGAVPVAAAAAGNGRRSISGRVMLALCASAATLEFFVFGGQAAGGGGGGAGHGAWARSLGLAALRALPAAATATFFLGMILVVVAHVRAGGEGGGGTGAVVAGAGAGDGPHQGLLRVLTKITAGMAAALVGLMLMALTLHGSKS